MTKALSTTLAGIGLLFSQLSVADFDAGGFVEAEFRHYPSEALFEDQKRSFTSIAVQGEFSWSSENEDHEVNFKPFGRYSSSDGNRSHADIRELYYLYSGTGWQLEAGFNKVYWGVAESAHLVDIINQTDVVESFNGEEKLGQPLISLGLEKDAFGNIDLYVLPYFRERKFTEGDEPYQISLGSKQAIIIDYDNTLFESNQKESHVDFAGRWAQSFSDLDMAISVFHGTDREPLILPAPSEQDLLSAITAATSKAAAFELVNGFPMPEEQLTLVRLDEMRKHTSELALYYQQLTQVGLELQYLYDDLFLKFEGTSKYQNTGNYLSYVAGFEYTFADMEPFGQDVGILVEYLWNNRKALNIASMTYEAVADTGITNGSLGNYLPVPGNYYSPFENDVFVGMRFNMNNVDSTQFVAGLIHDIETHSQMSTFEGSTRIGDSLKLSINAYFLSNIEENSSLYYSRRDDLVEVKAAWYF